jgi:UDP-N-acetylmuramoylalanine--D-glutamate ligase
LELSSFQLEDLPKIGVSPTIALVTNLIDNHLDRHGTMANYAAAKQNIYRYQRAGDTLILNRSDAATAAWAPGAPGAVKWYDNPLAPIDLLVPGPHNQINAQAAMTAASVFLNSAEDLSPGLAGFAGLPHRLQFVVEQQGVRYYNDSKSTTPSGAMVALNAFDPGKTILLAGGYDKQSPFDELATVAVARAKAVIAFGQTAPKIVTAIESQSDHDGFATEVSDLRAAVTLAQGMSAPGDVIVLSPACASHDQFTNYEQRGDQFVACVGRPSVK